MSQPYSAGGQHIKSRTNLKKNTHQLQQSASQQEPTQQTIIIEGLSVEFSVYWPLRGRFVTQRWRNSNNFFECTFFSRWHCHCSHFSDKRKSKSINTMDNECNAIHIFFQLHLRLSFFPFLLFYAQRFFCCC